ncbi:hypothetical protein [Halostagnicola bangensis]
MDLFEDVRPAEDVLEAANATASEHGSKGFWGLEETEPDHSLSIHGGWSSDETYTDDRVNAEHLALLYRFPERDSDDNERYSLWLWTRVASDDETLSRLEFDVRLPSTLRMIDHSPKGTMEDAEQVVGSDTKESATLATTQAPQIRLPHAPTDITYDVGDSSFGWDGTYSVALESSQTELSLTATAVIVAETDDLEPFEEIEWQTVVQIE